MSDNTEIEPINNNTNEWINWIKEAISKKYIKYYEYENFHNIKEISSGEIGKFYRANWKDSYKHLILRSFTNYDDTTVKEIVRELELHHEVDFHENFIQFYGVTTSNEENQIDRYMLVMDDADGGTLQDYLKKNFHNLTWNDKFNLAFQLANAVSYLHEEGIKIVHGDLRSSNVFVHQNIIKLADLGMSKRIESKSSEIPREIIAYVDPKKYIKRKKKKKKYQLKEKSDVYSVGVILWEISSGRPPFQTYVSNSSNLDEEISKNNLREEIIQDTPLGYSNLYTECWKPEPDERPIMSKVVKSLSSMILENNSSTNNYQTIDSKMNNNIKIPSNVNDLLYGGLSQVIQNIEISANEIIESLAILKEKFSIIVDEIVNLISKNLNEGKEGKEVKEIVIDYLDNNNINLKVTYDLLLNNQNSSNSIFLLGYFDYYGIIIEDINYEKAYSSFVKSLEKNNLLSQYYLFEIIINTIIDLILENLNEGKEEFVVKQIVIKYLDNNNINSQIIYDLLLNNQNNSNSIFLLGYFNYYGIFTTKENYEKAFSLFIDASKQNHILAQYYVGICYEFGNGTTIKNEKLAFEYYEKIANKLYALGEFKVGYFYDKGIGIEKDEERAIHWYEKAADIGHFIAAYNL
ncbi:kinase-like domain-containing protein, partial [Rhizophagus irregularis DAOM 181602=DAOM 197198]